MTIKYNSLYSDSFGTKSFKSCSQRGMYSDRSEFLSSVVPSSIQSRGVVPSFSILGRIENNCFRPLNIQKELEINIGKEKHNEHEFTDDELSNCKLKELCLEKLALKGETQYGIVYKIGAIDRGIVVLTYYGTAHVYDTINQNWKDINLEDENSDGKFIVDMEVSAANVFLITSDQNIYAFSNYNVWGQTGTSDKVTTNIANQRIVARKVKIPEGVKAFGSVYSGYGHSYFVTIPDKRIYFSGNCTLGQYATKKNNDFLEPVEIQSPLVKGKSVKLMTSGNAHCIAVFEDDSGIVFGYNDHQQLGYATPIAINDPLPLNVPTSNKIKSVQSGQWISLVCTEQNEIFTCGFCCDEENPALVGDDQPAGWKKLDLNLYGINPSSLFDAYLIQNKIFLLTLGKVYF